MNGPLDTERLRLRPFTVDDAEAWHAIWGDPEVIWWGPSDSLDRSRTGLARLIQREAETWPPGLGWLAVMEKGSDEIVGDVLLQPAPFVDGIEVGWHFRTHVWSRGYATEAARATVERAFADGVCDRVWAVVATTNLASLRVAEKLGMRAVKDMEYEDLPHRMFVLEAQAAEGEPD